MNFQIDPKDIFPKLRNLDPMQVEIEGSRAIALRDPLQMSDQILCVPVETLPFLFLLDGKHSLLDIQTELSRREGSLVFLDHIQAFVQKMDEVFLLHGDRFNQAYREKVEDYRKQPFRPSSHAGMSYNGDPGQLTKEIQEYFTENGGPGLPDYFSDSRRPVGLIAPHIDIRAGGGNFAKAYHALATGRPSDIYVILGTGHAGVQGLFTTTTLDFETPLGRVRTDREFVDKLSGALGTDSAREEILHATEHVIEFQLIFLQHIFNGRHDFSIVPILCSLSHLYFDGGESFADQRRAFETFCKAIREVCNAGSKSVCFIASADLDHVGPRYGDRFEPHQGMIDEALEKDSSMLSSLEQLDLDAFVGNVVKDNDSRRICGFSPITAMLSCMDAKEGRLLGLDYAKVDDKNSFVSFASMIFH